MKKLFIALLALFILSCSLDENQSVSYLPVPIESVSMPESFVQGQTYQIDLTYLKPNNCYSFHDIYFVKEDNTRTVAIINAVLDSGNCQTSGAEIETSFNFIVNDTGSYIFKFWQGEDNQGEDIYLTIEIPVE